MQQDHWIKSAVELRQKTTVITKQSRRTPDLAGKRDRFIITTTLLRP